MAELRANFESVSRRLEAAAARAGKALPSIRLVGVSKSQPSVKILELARLGLRDFGENYVQEWQKKRAELEKLDPRLARELRWHFIGHLQSNKASLIASQVDLLHSVDSLKLAAKISEGARRLGLKQDALLEVNLAGEPGKSGLSEDELLSQLQAFSALPAVHWLGLMAVPPAAETAEAARPYFRRLKSLLDECNRSGFLNKPMVELSMGMSQDFEVAIEEGATLVRVGTALFGSRE